MSRSTQSKAQNEANTRILRATVKLPENKVCVDCKRNDPRWASWNLGCFMCIRCSGIHRSMGTHISKVKSIDLDIWTPEQMASIQKWGNARCNAYWEAHLKPGHIPPEHKIESFIRSKYETRRWARSGPIPEDPSVLDAGEGTAAAASSSSAALAPAAKAASKPAPSALDLLGGDPSPAAATTSFTSPQNSRRQASLLDGLDSAPSPAPAAAPVRAAAASPPQAAPAKAPAAAKSGGGGGLFDLDWADGPTSPPTASAKPAGAASGAKGKNDILSLFATAKPIVPPGAGGFGSPESAVSPSGGGGGAGAFGGLDAFGGLNLGGGSNGGSGFGGSGNSFGATSPASKPAGNGIPGSNPWASNSSAPSAATSSDPFTTGTSDIWGSSTTTANSSGGFNAPSKPAQPAARTALDDLWGDFK